MKLLSTSRRIAIGLATFASIGLLVSGLLYSKPSDAVTQDITNQFQITRSGLLLNRSTNTFDSTVTLKNVSSMPVLAPIAVVVNGLPAGVTLVNSGGTTLGGKPFVTATLVGSSLPPSGTVSVVLKYSNPQRISLYTTVQVLYTGDLPLDPGDAGKATIEGVDSNGNGVRDDVERWIAFNFSTSEKTRAALMRKAEAFQDAVVVGKTKNASAALDAYQGNSDSIACLNYVVGKDTMVAASKKLLAETLNTSARLRAYDDYLALLPIFLEYDAPFGKGACALMGFDPDMARN